MCTDRKQTSAVSKCEVQQKTIWDASSLSQHFKALGACWYTRREGAWQLKRKCA